LNYNTVTECTIASIYIYVQNIKTVATSALLRAPYPC